MSSCSWFSANENGEVVSKTDIHDNGEIHKYPYTKEDDITKGHGHEVYNNIEDFINGEASWSRDKDDPRSKNRIWKGNGYSLTINELLNIKEELISSRYYTSRKLLLKK
jgi:hypothetical protein